MFGPILLGSLPLMAFASYSVTQEKRLMEHSYRKELVELTEKVPGIALAEAQGQLGCSKSAIDHHVQVLVARERLKRVCVGHMIHLFPAHTENARGIAALMESHARAFAKAVVERPGTNLAGIEKRTGIDRKMLRRCARILAETAMVVDKGKEKRHSFEPTSRLVPAMRRAEATLAARRSLGTATTPNVESDA